MVQRWSSRARGITYLVVVYSLVLPRFINLVHFAVCVVFHSCECAHLCDGCFVNDRVMRKPEGRELAGVKARLSACRGLLGCYHNVSTGLPIFNAKTSPKDFLVRSAILRTTRLLNTLPHLKRFLEESFGCSDARSMVIEHRPSSSSVQYIDIQSSGVHVSVAQLVRLSGCSLHPTRNEHRQFSR